VPALSADPSSSTAVASPTPAATTVLVPGTAEWAGPREKSNLLAVAAGPSSSVTNLSTVRPDASEARARAAGVATSKANVLDTDPTWDPNRSVLGFTRRSGDGSDIGYVVPGVGQRPDGQVDKGITVKDPIDDSPPSGTHDHAPAWMDDGDLLFARTRQCAPSRDCAEDVVRSELTRIGDYIEVTSERPVVVSADWSEIRNISAEPGGTGRFLVTGRNRDTAEIGRGSSSRWSRVRRRVPKRRPRSSARRHRALVGGSEAGWGPVLAVWSSIDAPSPRFIDAFFVLGRFAGVANVPSAAEAEFGWISISPLDDGRYAVLISSGTVARTGSGPLPVIGLLDPDFAMSEVVEPRPPSGQTWKQTVALGW
jgi:hypothetical protein